MNKIYIEKNRVAWNTWTQLHVGSDFYDNEAFLKGKCTLQPTEMEILGDIEGKSILHLQCHFGQDSISLARMGAKVTAVDISDVAIETAKLNAQKSCETVNFICSDVSLLSDIPENSFDIVFTSYGTTCWLPDLMPWGKVINRSLKRGGKFVIVDFHPLVYMLNDNLSDFQYSYFNSGAIIETSKGSYAARESDVEVENVSWNHSMSEIIMSLIENNLNLVSFNEYDHSPYNCFSNLIKVDESVYKMKNKDISIPMTYSLVVTKR